MRWTDEKWLRPELAFFRKFEFWHLSTSFRMRCARLFRKSRSYTADASSLSNMSGKTSSQTVFKKKFLGKKESETYYSPFFTVFQVEMSLPMKNCCGKVVGEERGKEKRIINLNVCSGQVVHTLQEWVTYMQWGGSLSPLRRRFLKVGRKVLKNTEEAKKQVSVELETSWLVGKGKEVLWL